ncbi:MAG: GNAT family N-acetyltransferase [Gammaproteobacteria bacterium]|nr:GNAT family N-acetyltransferase [Gammaproteobacteria bacterium]MDH3766833.1 GNAT family N-acetyltransferase [Gammaproteobacteria bacterium]
MAVELYSDLNAIPADTARLLSIRSGVPFFKSIEWFRCLVQHGLEPARLRVYIEQAHGDSLCALYCLDDRKKLKGLVNFYTTEYGPVMSGLDTDAGMRSILSFIAAERPRLTTIDLRNLREDDLQSLSRALDSVRFTAHEWQQYKNWYLDVADQSFEQYYAALASQLRNTIERKSRKAAREHELRLVVYPDASLTLDEAIRHFETVYAASWKEDEPFPGFMSALIRTCHEHDMARIGLAWVDGQPAATQFWIKDHDRAVIYKLAYDEKFADLSIGSLLSKTMFQHAIDVESVAEIDYGVGDEAYKRDWMSDCRQLSGLMACNRRTLGGRLASLREYVSSIKR